jgi:hypothetical protein
LTIAPVQDHEELLELVAPYASWAPRHLPDPRTSSIAQIAEGLASIVGTEGPLLDHRAFRLYTHAAGLGRASQEIKSRYDKAVEQAVRNHRMVAEPDTPESDALVLRSLGAARILLRESGNRTLEEIPLAEITSLIRKLELSRGEAYASPEERFRRVLEVYELIRLTAKSRARLEAACERANLPSWSFAITESHEPSLSSSPAPRPRRPQRRLRHG